MNRQSIFFTITVSFIISIILVIVSFGILMTENYKVKESQLFEKYIPIIKVVLRKHHKGGLNLEFAKSLEDSNFTLFNNKGNINAITYNPLTKVLLERKDVRDKIIFRVLKLKDNNYLYIKKKKKTILIKDNSISDTNTQIYIVLVFAIVIITIILMYLITIRKLMPLKRLKDKVKTLGDENFDFDCCNSDSKDEVSLLGMEFKKTALKLKSLKEARNVFIRNIMHELKTPITKGNFLTQLEQNKENNEKLKSVFSRLELLINEFASIEELISSTKNIEKKFYFLDDVIDNAKDILMIEDEIILGSYDNKKININFKLFSIAIKNLIDNAIKYSNDKKVTIKTEDGNIIFENNGKKLEYDLEKYFEPFFANEDKSKDSFGLGLYIVHNILKANGYSLEYEYKNGINRFICKKDNSSTI
ncbi:HAMP domain-containing histidine kinase [Poseidonibacter lekithochrous]|uniref:ArsS family sensor histidine kinase n=1 Tax=Poseidonibacter TaxID=2321187 RepID=UPI001C0995B5|nr:MULTISPECIES: ArsS family sensor histidine kinase [Poseidonibacter]MBU3015408.1 HAMP domain-containing histidine kinase [Poseidonibacter lekithochrous]MDO6828707.1 ArsS family sensor histidine kinase [Poseidonibacter sp. 1_MG-2023]